MPQELPLHTPIASSFLHVEQVCHFKQRRPVHRGQLGTAGELWQGTYLCIRLYALDYNNQSHKQQCQ